MKRTLLLGASLLTMADVSQCPEPIHVPTPPQECRELRVPIPPDGCFELPIDPCDGRPWASAGVFSLVNAPSNISTEAEVNGFEQHQFVCATGTIPTPTRIQYSMAALSGLGEGFLTVMTADPVFLDVTAIPSVLSAGETTQLRVTAMGGLPPYEYSWAPDPSLSATDVAAPFATPTIDTTFTVTVTDSIGVSAKASVTVTVNRSLTIEASATTIDVGDNVSLRAVPIGGHPPYQYSWTRASGNPTFPSSNQQTAGALLMGNTDTFTVAVTDEDGLGATQTASIEISVRLWPRAAMVNAHPLLPGESAVLVVDVLGGDGRYSYSWSPATGLSNPSSNTVTVTPSTSTTYVVQVTDGHGQTATTSVAVTVTTSGPLSASFTYTKMGSVPPYDVVLDARTSTGPIVEYLWNFSWLGAPLHTTDPVLTFRINNELEHGTATLTVVDAAGHAATFSVQRFP